LERDDKHNETMEILNDPLPAEIVDAARNAKGNFATKNAQYRQAVCNYLGLRWQPIGGKRFTGDIAPQQVGINAGSEV
jgi:hypothetical protein